MTKTLSMKTNEMTTSASVGAGSPPMVKYGVQTPIKREPKKKKTFKEYIGIKEGIKPSIKEIKSIEKDYLEKTFPDIRFYPKESNQCGGYSNGNISINLNCIKNISDIYTNIYHESIHQIQDKKSLLNILSIIAQGRDKITDKELRTLYNITNSFEIMAYASTFAIMLKLNLKPLKGYDSFFRNSNMKGIYEIINNSKSYKAFKKYLYLYYKEIDVPEEIIKNYIMENNPEYIKEYNSIHEPMIFYVF